MNMKSATKFCHLFPSLCSNRSLISVASKQCPLAESTAGNVLALRALLATADVDAGPGPVRAGA
jgi:hypothetical protein